MIFFNIDHLIFVKITIVLLFEFSEILMLEKFFIKNSFFHAV